MHGLDLVDRAAVSSRLRPSFIFASAGIAFFRSSIPYVNLDASASAQQDVLVPVYARIAVELVSC